MDSAIGLLKDEINQTFEAEHDLAKWKLACVAVLGAAAFGISDKISPQPWALILIPFLCAYIDLFCYQYQLRVLVISRFIQKFQPLAASSNQDDAVLVAYEIRCERVRTDSTGFSYGNIAELICSVGASLFAGVSFFLIVNAPENGPRFAWWVARPIASSTSFLSLLALGVIMIIALKWSFEGQKKKVGL